MGCQSGSARCCFARYSMLISIGRQQDAGLAVRDALRETDAFEQVRQLGHRSGAELGQHVPAAIGVVQGAHARLADQRGDHAAGLVAFDADAHPRADPVRLGIRPQVDGVASDHALVFKLAQTVGDGAAGSVQLRRERCDRHARVAAQQRDELPVEIVQGHQSGARCASAEKPAARSMTSPAASARSSR